VTFQLLLVKVRSPLLLVLLLLWLLLLVLLLVLPVLLLLLLVMIRMLVLGPVSQVLPSNKESPKHSAQETA
jgi:hypothetical protein